MRTVGQSTSVSLQQQLGELLRMGLRLHQAGRWAEAEERYGAALRLDPEQPDALHLLGVLKHQRGESAQSGDYLLRAVKRRPNEATFQLHLGLAQRASGDLIGAERSFRSCVRLAPGLVDGLINLGALLISQERARNAVPFLMRARSVDPLNADAAANLGAAWMALEQTHDAMAALRDAVALRPDHLDALANLGHALRRAGDLIGARDAYARLVALQPNDPAAVTRLGEITQLVGDLESAMSLYRRAIEIDESYADAHNNLGAALGIKGDADAAIRHIERALELAPDYVEALSNRGSLEMQRGGLDAAMSSFRRSLQVRPTYSVAHSNLIFAMDLDDTVSAHEAFAERRRWNAIQTAHVTPFSEWLVTPDPQRKLHIGYVSADFSRHSAAMVFAPVILNHDRSQVDITCYSGVQTEDALTHQFRQAAGGWRSTVGVPDDTLAEQIRDDRIDILVDLSGHSVGNRLGVFAHKPAPVQVTAWGYATGTGLAAMDYFLGDAIASPPEAQCYFSETIVELPAIAPYLPPDNVPPPTTLPALQRGFITFGSFNRVQKLTPSAVELWASVLRRIGESRLVIKSAGADQPEVQNALVRSFAGFGIEPARLTFLGSTGQAEHLAAYSQIDISLDPIPHGGGVTALEGLWMGVPTLTLPGDRVQSRLAASFLTTLNLTAFIASDSDDFINRAADWARRTSDLAEVRADLRPRMAASIVCDGRAYCRATESAYRAMWRRWCSSSGTPTGAGPTITPS